MKKKFRHLYGKEEELRSVLENADAHGLSAEARERCGWFLYALETRGSIDDICDHFGIAPTTWYRWSNRVKELDPADPGASLEDGSRAPHRKREPETDDRVEALIISLREKLEKKGPRSIRISLKQEHGIELSASTIWRVLNRKKQGDAKRGKDGSGNGSSFSTMAATFIFAVATAISFTAPSAEAAGTSSNFRIDFDSIQTETRQGNGSSFTVIGGLTNIFKSGAGSLFRIEPYSLLPAAETDSLDESADEESTSTTTASSGGSGGRRGSAEQMAKVIAEAHKAFLSKREGDQEPGAERGAGGAEGEGAIQNMISPVMRSYRERLLATVDGRRVIYRDVTTDKWYTPYVAFVVGKGIAHGYKTEGGWLTGVFGVGNLVTKAEALKMTLLAAGEDIPEGGEALNASARGTWAEPYVGKAEELELSGYQLNDNVHEPQTRAGVVRTIMEIVGLPLAHKAAPFSDIKQDNPENPAIVTAAFFDLISGFPDGTFRPDAFMNRASAAKVMTMVRRMLMQ